MEENKEEDLKTKYQMYLDERRMLIETEFEQSATLDKALLAISTGVFSLAIAFVEKMIQTQEHKALLVTSLLLFAFTILTTLYSFFFSQRAMRFQVNEVLFDTIFSNKKVQRNWYSCITRWMNNLSIISLTCAIVFLAIFISINI